MEINNMKYQITAEVNKQVQAEIHDKKISRSIEVMFLVIISFLIGFIAAKVKL